MSEGAWEYDILVKLLVVGDSAVGKSCMLLRYSEDSFCETHMTTIGVDFKLKTKIINNKTAKIQIWDTAGQERFRTITASYYRGAHGIILTFDLTNERTFEHCSDWLVEIKENASDDVTIILVGNKSDLVKERVVSAERARAFAKKHGMKYVETSAKNGTNIDRAFDAIILKVIDKQNYLSSGNNNNNSGGRGNNVVRGPRLRQNQGRHQGGQDDGGCCW